MAKKKAAPKKDLSLELRPVIRETMQAAPTRRWTVAAMLIFLRRDFPEAGVMDVKKALGWNLSRDFVDCKTNHETEAEEWFLTSKGRNA